MLRLVGFEITIFDVGPATAADGRYVLIDTRAKRYKAFFIFSFYREDGCQIKLSSQIPSKIRFFMSRCQHDKITMYQTRFKHLLIPVKYSQDDSYIDVFSW